MTESYTLTKQIITVLTQRGHVIQCYYCGLPLEVGQAVISTSSRRKRYHASCYDKLFFVTKEEAKIVG